MASEKTSKKSTKSTLKPVKKTAAGSSKAKTAKKQDSKAIKAVKPETKKVSKTVTKKPAISATVVKKTKGKAPKHIVKAEKSASSKTQKTQESRSFLAFLGLLVAAGFLVGGLFASFSYYESLIADQPMSTKTGTQLELPSTGVQESKMDEPLPTSTEPGLNNASKSTSDTSSSSSASSDMSAQDPRQPSGTTKFNKGDYKVYQYPDGNNVVVW